MGLYDIIQGIDDRFINEELKSFIITYKEDNGKDQTSRASGTSESDAKRRFMDSKEGRNIRVTSAIEDTEEALDEENSTSNLDGGLGQPKIPHAFQRTNPTDADKKKEQSNATRSTGYGIAPTTSDYIKRRNEMFDRTEKMIDRLDEVSYSDYRNDESASAKKKINTSIMEVNRRLYEVERMLTHAMRLKSESGADDIFWQSTKSRFSKISERMLRIGTKLREFNS